MAADFDEHRWLRAWPSDGVALTDAVAALQARGATWLRSRFRAQEVMVEGWLERPGLLDAHGHSAAVTLRGVSR